MEKSNPIHQPLFRLFSPLVYGTMVYILVLLLNDRFAQLSENFEIFEMAFSILLTLIVAEGLRGYIILLDRMFPFIKNLKIRVVLQLMGGILVALALVYLTVSVYFIYLVGFSTFSDELSVFSMVFIISAIFYNLVHLSIFLLNEQNSEVMKKEASMRKSLEFRLQAFKNEVNPDLLYGSLETLLSLIKKDVVLVDDYLERLSAFYRFSLDNRHEELVSLEKELQSAQNLIYLLNFEHRHLYFEIEVPFDYAQMEVVPGAVTMLLQHLVRHSIISETLPLQIKCFVDGTQTLALTANMNERLKPLPDPMKEIHDLQQAYAFYTSDPVVRVKAYQEITLKLPLLSLELEELE